MRALEVTGAENEARGRAVRAHELGAVDPTSVECAHLRFASCQRLHCSSEREYTRVIGGCLCGSQPEPAASHRNELPLEAHVAVLRLQRSQEGVDVVAHVWDAGADLSEE